MRLARAVGALLLVGMGLTVGAAATPPVTIYMALGDSIAAGQGASTPAQSYVGRELVRLQAVSGPNGARLVRFASGGATSEGVLRWQAPPAVEELTALREGRRPGLRPGPITLTIGGNDLLGLLGLAMMTGRLPDETVLRATIERVERNLEATLAELVTAGGPGIRITVTTYYNPFGAAPAGSPVARLGALGVAGVNGAILRVATRYPEQVRVARVDEVLPADSRITAYLADQIHPNDRGHAAIAAATAAAWPTPGRPVGDAQAPSHAAATP